MGKIKFNFTWGCSLEVMVPLVGGGGGVIPDKIPKSAGFYMIFNGHNNNRYCGCSENVWKRFNLRLQVVAELGLDVELMENIWALGGIALVTDTSNFNGILNPHTRDIYSTHTTIDGKSVDLETVLILFVKNHLGNGGTITNTLKIDNYYNFTQKDIEVTLAWNEGPFCPGFESTTWAKNAHI